MATTPYRFTWSLTRAPSGHRISIKNTPYSDQRFPRRNIPIRSCVMFLSCARATPNHWQKYTGHGRAVWPDRGPHGPGRNKSSAIKVRLQTSGIWPRGGQHPSWLAKANVNQLVDMEGWTRLPPILDFKTVLCRVIPV